MKEKTVIRMKCRHGTHVEWCGFCWPEFQATVLAAACHSLGLEPPFSKAAAARVGKLTNLALLSAPAPTQPPAQA